MFANVSAMSSGGFRTTHYQITLNNMKSTELGQQTNPPLLIASVRQSALLFRAWNRELKEMFWFDLMWGSLHNKGTGWIGMLPIEQKERKEIKSFTQSDDRIAIDPTNCDIMNFTGLKDKNGVEICEGDIVICKEATDPEEKGFICLIKDYRLKFNNVNFIEDDFYGTVNYDYISQKTEIIGNIYENTELINGAF
jgi:uncharacterized phage protein (TIGR01671 family)